MSKERILVGTRKGAFVLTSDGKRQNWNVSGPHFAGWEMYHLKGSPVNPNRIYASQTSGWFGQIIQRSDDGGKTWIQPGTPPGEKHAKQPGPPKGESNKFVYDTSAETGKPLTTHMWYDGTQHPWEFKRVWHIEPSLTDADTVYAGVEDAGLFRSTDGGKNWKELAGLRGHGTGPRWQPGAGGMCLHTIILDPKDPKRIYIAISAAGAFRTDDGGNTWKPINKGLYSQYIPEPTAEVGHCVHHVAMNPARPNVLFMQKHWDVMRSDNAGDSWKEVSGNLPTDFGFVIDVHAHEAEVGRQVAADFLPGVAGVVAAHHIPMFLHEEDVWARGVHRNVMNAVADFGRGFGNVLGVEAFVDRLPRIAAVVGAERTCGRDGNVDPLRIFRIQNDGVQAHAACAGLPARAGTVTAQSRQFLPVLSAVGRAE